jgi:predicted RNase H-like nuclease
LIFISGVDACKGGWLSVSKDLLSGHILSEIYASVESLVNRSPRSIVIAVDIPIGLTDSGQRECDRLAREILGRPRSSSVFPAPVRPALRAENRRQADEITRSIDGRGVGAQAWGLYARIREFDGLVASDPMARRCIYEVHPELSFMAWNGGIPIRDSKRSHAGMNIRAELVKAHFGLEALQAARQRHQRGGRGSGLAFCLSPK